jgi:hypothetical protein
LSQLCTQNKFCGYREKRTKVRWSIPNRTVYQGIALVIAAPPLYRGVALVFAALPVYQGIALVIAALPYYRGVALVLAPCPCIGALCW